MNKDGKIHFPAMKKTPLDQQTMVRLAPEAYNLLVNIRNASTLSINQIASILIVEAAGLVVYDEEEQ